jgi:uncharacterized membrane protein YdcZ (DUF606 family)
MPNRKADWIYAVGGVVGGVFIAFGIIGLSSGISVGATFLAVLGFLIAGWAVLDYRRFQRGTPESEVDGGRTIE